MSETQPEMQSADLNYETFKGITESEVSEDMDKFIDSIQKEPNNDRLNTLRNKIVSNLSAPEHQGLLTKMQTILESIQSGQTDTLAEDEILATVRKQLDELK